MSHYVITMDGQELTVRGRQWVYVPPGQGLRFVRQEDAEALVAVLPWNIGREPRVERRADADAPPAS